MISKLTYYVVSVLSPLTIIIVVPELKVISWVALAALAAPCSKVIYVFRSTVIGRGIV